MCDFQKCCVCECVPVRVHLCVYVQVLALLPVCERVCCNGEDAIGHAIGGFMPHCCVRRSECSMLYHSRSGDCLSHTLSSD